MVVPNKTVEPVLHKLIAFSFMQLIFLYDVA